MISNGKRSRGRISRKLPPEILAVSLSVLLPLVIPSDAKAEDASVARGRYLVQIGGCNDCHTPGYFLGKPDQARFLGGSDVGLEVPGLGTFYGPNLTPDVDTGLGSWSEGDIVAALRTGVTPEGRALAPVMPWPNLAALTDEDAGAIAAYLKSLPPVANEVPGPLAPGEAASTFVMKVVPPAP